MFKRMSSLILCLFITASVFSMPFNAHAKTYKEQLLEAGFPESYVSDLEALHNKYPNWVFEVFNTGLDWQTAVNGERSSHSKQIVQMSSSKGDPYYCQCEKCKPSGKYKIQEGSSWVSASEQAVKYYMDPRNWLSEKYIFQFESTSYESVQNKSGVESIISSTWMKNADITYNSTTSQPTTFYLDGKTVKYSDAILAAAKNSGMSAYYLASKIVQEVGASSPTTGGSCGTRAPFIGIYNYYNIGANTGAMDGLEWASGYLMTNRETQLYYYYDTANNTVITGEGNEEKLASSQRMSYISTYGDYYYVKLYNSDSGSYSTDGKTGFVNAAHLRTTYFNYGRPWINPYLSIYYGAQYIAKNFSAYQNTGYLQKFNVNKASGQLYNHEYMANADGASSEAAITYKAYGNANILSGTKTFYIPVFNNMPAEKCTLSSSAVPETTTAANMVTGLTLDSRTKTSLTFKWDAFSGATKYYVYVKNLTKGTNFNKTVKTNSATLNNLTPASEYSVKVKAYTSGGWSSYSAYNTKHALPDKMSAPKVKSKGDTSVTLSWTPVDGADGYYIYTYNSSTKKYTLVKTVEDGKASSAKVTGLSSATKHTFAMCVYTVDSKTKTGAKSSKVSAETKLLKVKLKSVSSPKTTKIKVKWNKTKGSENGYQIYYAKDKKFKKIVAKKEVTSKATASYTGKNFTKGTKYYVKVRTYKTVKGKKKYGSWSNVKSVKSK